MCTAFCVAKDVVATAGHCLLSTAGERPPRFADFWFPRNYDAAREIARIAGHANGTAAQQRDVGSTSLNVRPPIDATRDWALVRLARPACTKGVLPVRVLPIERILSEAEAKRVFQIAYHRDYMPVEARLRASPAAWRKSFETSDWKHDRAGLLRSRGAAAAYLRHGRGLVGLADAARQARGPEVIGINVGTYVQSKVLMQDRQVKKRLKADTVANTAVASAAFAGKLEAFRAGGDPGDARPRCASCRAC